MGIINYGTKDTITYYLIQVESILDKDISYCVDKRYNDFYTLHSSLVEYLSTLEITNASEYMKISFFPDPLCLVRFLQRKDSVSCRGGGP